MTAEKFIKAYTRRCSNELVSVETKDGKEVRSYHPWMTVEGALQAVGLARKDALLAIKHEIAKCAANNLQFPVLHLLDYIDKELGIKPK